MKGRPGLSSDRIGERRRPVIEKRTHSGSPMGMSWRSRLQSSATARPHFSASIIHSLVPAFSSRRLPYRRVWQASSAQAGGVGVRSTKVKPCLVRSFRVMAHGEDGTRAKLLKDGTTPVYGTLQGTPVPMCSSFPQLFSCTGCVVSSTT